MSPSDFIVWNWPFAAASFLTFLVFGIHLFAGGREAVKPMLAAEGLSRQAKMTLYYAWHLITVGLLAAALVFLVAALRVEWLPIAWAVGLVMALFAAVSMVQTVLMRLPLTMVPQWMFFGPIAALALWASMR